jgi:hypothetical protein
MLEGPMKGKPLSELALAGLMVRDISTFMLSSILTEKFVDRLKIPD